MNYYPCDDCGFVVSGLPKQTLTEVVIGTKNTKHLVCDWRHHVAKIVKGHVVGRNGMANLSNLGHLSWSG